MKTKENKAKETLTANTPNFRINWDSVDTIMKRKREETREFLKNAKLPL